MTPGFYKAERKRRGTQEEVAAALGVSRVTIARRETGTRPITKEAWLALSLVRLKKAEPKRRQSLDRLLAKASAIRKGEEK